MRNIFISIVFFSLIFVGCSARINGNLYENGSADLSLNTALEPRMAVLIRSFSRLNNNSSTQNNNVIDGASIAASMTQAPGVKAINLRNINPTTIEGTINIAKINDFLTISGSQNFISYEQTGTNGKITITLNRNTAPQIVSVLSPDIADYLSALMAPVATGEALSRREYISLVQSVYGRGVADEISSARVQLSITFPRQINTIRGGTISGTSRNRGEFDIPLIDLLVLENNLIYEVTWR